MTKDEIMAMSLVELRAKIAELKGYKWFESDGVAYLTKDNFILPKGTVEVVAPTAARKVIRCPNWSASIHDAWNLEGTLLEEELGHYANILEEIVEEPLVVGDESFTWALCRATPEQRCRAWLIWKKEVTK